MNHFHQFILMISCSPSWAVPYSPVWAMPRARAQHTGFLKKQKNTLVPAKNILVCSQHTCSISSHTGSSPSHAGSITKHTSLLRPQKHAPNCFSAAKLLFWGNRAAGAGGTSRRRWGNRPPNPHQPIPKQKVRTPKASLVGEKYKIDNKSTCG